MRFLKAKQREKRRRTEITSLSLHSSDHKTPLPSPFDQRDGLFLRVQVRGVAQQKCDAAVRAVLTSGQEGEKEKKYPDVLSHSVVVRGPFSQSPGQKEEIFLGFYYLLSLFLISPAIGSRPRAKVGKFNPGTYQVDFLTFHRPSQSD